jgi:chloramphenicol 3-O phosphotransferase
MAGAAQEAIKGIFMTLFEKTTRYVCAVAMILFMSACETKKDFEKSGTVIILNGPSSSGKSSIIKAFQAKRDTLWICAGIDNLYASVIPQKFFLEDTPEHYAVMKVSKSETKEGPVINMTFGTEGQKIFKGMNRAIAAYARVGNNVIVDYIQHDPIWIYDLKEALNGINVIWVGVTASLETIQQREKNRGDTPQGIALGHYHTVHQGMSYDLMIDTNALTPEQAADEITKFLEAKK